MIIFQSYSGVNETQGSLRGVLPRPDGRFAAGALGLTGRLPAPGLRLTVGASLHGMLPRPEGLFIPGDVLRGFLPRALFVLAQAPPQTASVLNAVLPLPQLKLTGARTSMTAALTVPVHLTMRLMSAGLAGLWARLPPPGARFTQQAPTPVNFFQLVQGDVLMARLTQDVIITLADHMQLADTSIPDFIHALIDLIQFSDSYGQLAQVLQQLHGGIGLADVARLIWETGLLDTFVASAVQAGTAQITVMLADSIDLGDTATALSEILAGIADGFYVGLVINTGDDGYTAWVMTPETKAMRSYTNYPFNSYATLGGHFIGACDTGIYRMGGDTDNGAAIRASIRTGLLNFGSLNMKSVNKAYVGATLSGSILLRVQATTTKGVDLEQTYRMVPAITGKPRQHPQAVGRGFQSVYWTFELANDTDGADFDVTTWHVLPVTLTGKLI
jgi:hypothetical protein